jgi:hypothetical protein
MTAGLPDYLVQYLIKRDQAHADRIAAVWSEFTEREQGLVKDAAVMGWIQGAQCARAGEGWPGDWVAVPTVIGACLGNPDFYPTITGSGPAEPEAPHPSQSRWRVEMYDPVAGQWAPGSSLPSLEAARQRLAQAEHVAPKWRDDKTPVQRRIVRETTTYAIEAPVADCPSCEVGIEHTVHCPTPETHNWGCGCPTDETPAAARREDPS